MSPMKLNVPIALGIAFGLGGLIVGCGIPPTEVETHWPSTIEISAQAERARDGGSIISGTTNLPDGFNLGIEIKLDRPPKFLSKVIVSDGHFRSQVLLTGKYALTAGKHPIRFLAYFNEAWQNASILRITGEKGAKLSGPMIRLIEPDLIDSDKRLEYPATLYFPPIPQSSQEERAIALVKAARLTVDGRISSETVEGGFFFYCQDPAIRIGRGWSAQLQSDGSIWVVMLDFINGKLGNMQAIWSINLDSKQIKYVNSYAKGFSYIPPE